MANIVGKGGCVKEDANVVAGIKTWTLDWNYDMFDVTEMADTAPTAHAVMPGLYSWGGSFTGNHTDGAAPLTPGTSYTLNLETDGTDKYSGTAYITGKSVLYNSHLVNIFLNLPICVAHLFYVLKNLFHNASFSFGRNPIPSATQAPPS